LYKYPQGPLAIRALFTLGHKKAPNSLKVKGFCGPDGEF
jgi:hypothetical protein